ncbi:multi-sensor hybrid histidine kinase [Ancylobacter novellus DSM 506]|uniref:histidine kinase n=1 Tax=Ancylobacter novellus (strain ATCC 8093 / DSM 506 / JCM 20403 / CCM 1077 / IAM 12100 / NBRC 12443 / NCIMB 10456) TaxID=639283 RepID=D7A285_ANCN5|nr:ATP-binding protein [Ancylobacter novellus]ADH89548.1 multi-sensor hybrid histidine kinase [Ancylobacter novellus DSM 506]
MADSGSDDRTLDRPEIGGSIRLVLLVALALVGAVVSLLLLGRERADPWIIGLLTVLAVVGVFALFAYATGLLRFGMPDMRDELARRVADSAPDGLCVVDTLGRVLYANPRYCEITGADVPAEARPVERLFTSDPDASEAVYRLAQGVREGKALTEEVRIAGPGQPVRWLKLGARPAAPGAKGAKSAVWTVSDLTRERERQETAFLELQHAIDYLDHAPAGFFSAAGGAIHYINATLVDWLGYDLAEFGPGGLTVADIVPGPAAALLTGMAPLPGGVRTEVLDLDLKRKNGQTLPVRLWHRVAFAADGTPGASRTLVVNRSREDNAADPARAAEVRFARFFHNSPIAIAAVDGEGRIVRANAMFARLFGTREGERRRLVDMVAEAARGPLETAVAAAVKGQAPSSPIDIGLDREGGRSARFYLAPVEDGGAEREAAIVYAIDTTEQRTLEAQFAQSQKMQAVGQLAGGVAHDFNNVLTAIIGYSDLLLANSRPTDPSFQDVMQIKQNANRAAGLVRQLLAFSRRQTLRPQVLNLGDVMSDLSMLLRRLLGETIKLEVKEERDLWPVKADLNQFEQVIVNLAVNARDAMPEGGTLAIRTANVSAAQAAQYAEAGLPAADHVLVEVTDTGAGIPPAIIDKIFEPFFTTKEVGKGTGLGLSTVYGIVKQTGGTLQVESEPGKGSIFRVFLPRHVPEVAAIAPKAAEAEAEAPAKSADLTGRGTLLLVEDEEAVRAFAARALASRGYQVLEAGSGVEALEVMETHAGEVDLVLSDVVMPEMDGPTLLKELRGTHPDIKVIFMSGYAEEAFAKNLPEGADFGFLPKPFTLKQLIEAVKTSMGRSE